MLYIILVLRFDAEDQEGNISTHDSVLPVEPVKHTGTYFPEDEHWSICSDGGNVDKFILRCEWPNVQLPQKPPPPEPQPEPPAMPMSLID